MSGTTLDQIPASRDPRHLLLIAQTKAGKSTYAAQAAIDGYWILYIDADNGISALRHALRNNPEAMKRVIYFRTESPYKFLNELLTKGVFRWNVTQDSSFSSAKAKPDDEVVEVIPMRIPHELILSIDSWTTVALDAMEVGADRKNVSLENLAGDQSMQSVYGDASMKLTLLCAVLQHVKFHCILQAHGTIYEMYEKPRGSQENVKQKHMILKDIIHVPLSSSRPHGYNMGKYFNEIGWLILNHLDQVQLDFTRKADRIGGGTPNRAGPVNEMSFAKLFGPAPDPDAVSINDSWFWKGTAEEWSARQPAKPTVTPSKDAGSSNEVLPAKPANPLMKAFVKK